MDQWSVFISSVIHDFSQERSAAQQAVENLRHTPVMAEYFGASPTTPQNSCMEQVRQSDVYIGIFGERYGIRGESGLSPTEEEFREAENQRLNILCFVLNGSLDADQKQFIDSIKSYEKGKFLAFYDSASELKDEITQALNDLSRASMGSGIDSTQARHKFDAKFNCDDRRGRGKPECRLAIIPERQLDEYLSPRDLEDDAFREKIEQQLQYGPKPRLFDRTKGIKNQDGEDFICLWQGDNDFQSADTILSIYNDGAIVLISSLSNPRMHDDYSYSMLRESVVDEVVVSKILEGFFAFCDNIYSSENSFQRESSFFSWMQLASVEQRMFGRLPTLEPNGFQMPMHSLDDPVCILSEPQRLVRKQLLDAKSLSDSYIARTARKFKAANAYYTCPG